MIVSRQAPMYAGATMASPAAHTHAPVMVPTTPTKTNLQLLYEATPEVPAVDVPPFDGDNNCKFWTEKAWGEWSQEQKEMGMFNSGVEGEGINSSWMEKRNG